MTENRITMNDVRKAGHCALGTKTWFEKYGFDFRDFLKNGIDEEKFLSTNDGLAQRIVRITKENRHG